MPYIGEWNMSLYWEYKIPHLLKVCIFKEEDGGDGKEVEEEIVKEYSTNPRKSWIRVSLYSALLIE